MNADGPTLSPARTEWHARVLAAKQTGLYRTDRTPVNRKEVANEKKGDPRRTVEVSFRQRSGC
jgi:hypothetical protein